MDNNNIALHHLTKRQHIQDHSQANTPYWGYASRVLPCTKDAGTCAYLDAVYGMHVTSMTYTFILWGVILGVLVFWSGFRMYRTNKADSLILKKFSRWKNGYFLPDAPLPKIFGRVTRAQLGILSATSIYLLIFSLVGIVYKTWITPIADSTLHNTRTGLGGWSDRLGALAYALTPFSVLLSQRESLLSILTGIPYQHFNFLHRWLGRIIFVQSFLHTLGWTLVEGKYYQPQPKVYVTFVKQQYVIFGIVAMFLITFLTVFSTTWAIRKTGYEFFKVAHWISAVLYIGACWGHWDKLWCWMVPSLALVVFDQLVRWVRMLDIHIHGNRHASGFQAATAEVKIFEDESGSGKSAVVRLDFDLEHKMAWEAGQHFYLTFPGLSLWESHPFTVASSPEINSKMQHHTYLLRARDGQTKKLAALGGSSTISTILTGPYGHGFPSYEAQHILAIAGGTGVTFTLPIIFEAVKQFIHKRSVMDFVWVVSSEGNWMWLGGEMGRLKGMLEQVQGLRVRVYVTRESREIISEEEQKKNLREKEGVEVEIDESSEVSTSSLTSSSSTGDEDVPLLEDVLALQNPRFSVSFLKNHHPSMQEILGDFLERVAMLEVVWRKWWGVGRRVWGLISGLLSLLLQRMVKM